MTAKKILVIDDDPVLNDLLMTIFEKEGYIVDGASDGQQGFDKAVTNDFDLVTMDIKMPNWNGVDAIRSLEIVKPSLKIIVISGYLNEIDEKQLSDAENVIKFIMKPFIVKELIKDIKCYFENGEFPKTDENDHLY